MDPKDERKNEFSYFYDKLGFETNKCGGVANYGFDGEDIEHICDKCHEYFDEADFGCMDKWELVKHIIRILLNRCFGLPEIKREIRLIESTVLSPTFGLAEIKREVRGLESAVAGLETAVAGISTSVLSPTFGLAEIKREVRLIESSVLSPTFGLPEIKREVRGLESAVAGLESLIAGIPSLIIVPTTCSSNVITTGPVISDVGSPDIVGKVLNNSLETRTVVVRAFNLETCPKAPSGTETLVLAPNCAEPFNLGTAPDEYEVQMSGAVPGVMIFTSSRSGLGRLNPANTFRYSEFVCR